MARRVSLSGTHLAANQVAEHHAVVEEAIHFYYTDASPGFETRFALYTEDEVLAERDERLYEAGAASAMMVLAFWGSGRIGAAVRQGAMEPAEGSFNGASHCVCRAKRNRVLFCDLIKPMDGLGRVGLIGGFLVSCPAVGSRLLEQERACFEPRFPRRG